MIAEKIKDVGLALGVLAGQVSEEQWALLKGLRADLTAAAEQVEEIEGEVEDLRNELAEAKEAA